MASITKQDDLDRLQRLQQNVQQGYSTLTGGQALNQKAAAIMETAGQSVAGLGETIAGGAVVAGVGKGVAAAKSALTGGSEAAEGAEGAEGIEMTTFATTAAEGAEAAGGVAAAAAPELGTIAAAGGPIGLGVAAVIGIGLAIAGIEMRKHAQKKAAQTAPIKSQVITAPTTYFVQQGAGN